jgi:hypothetical protein
VTLDDGAIHRQAFAYLSSKGHLSIDAAPAALAAIKCSNRRNRAINTAQALEHVRQRVAEHLGSNEFVHRLVDDDHYRQQVIDTIAADAGEFKHPMRILRSA